MQTRRVLLLIRAAIASVPALKIGCAATPGLLFALTLRADIVALVRLQNRLTEATLFRVLLFLKLLARLTKVIRLCLARDAEVISTFVAPDAICAHVFGCSFIDCLAIVLLESVVDLSSHDFDSVTTLAPHDRIVKL